MDLHDYIKAFGPLPEDKAKLVIKKLAEAVKHCHDNGIIHRDLKPDNILLKLDKNNDILDIQLADFGICKENKKHLCVNGFSGTPCFTAPEMFKFGQTFDKGVDIWCLGLISHFIMVGYHPMDKFENINEVAKFICQHEEIVQTDDEKWEDYTIEGLDLVE